MGGCYWRRRHCFVFWEFKEGFLPLRKRLLNHIINDEFTNVMFFLWPSLISFYKTTYYNILSSKHVLQTLLPFQQVSLIVNVLTYRTRMVFYQLQTDSDYSHGVKFAFLILRWLACTSELYRSLCSTGCCYFPDLFLKQRYEMCQPYFWCQYMPFFHLT